MDPMQMIPEAWRAWLAVAAMYALGAVALVTLAAHTLLPIAKRIEQWAIASSVTWDNKPARKLVEILAWIVGLTDLLWALPRFTIGRSEPAAPRDPNPKLNSRKPPSDGALAIALIVVAAACSIAASGCSAGPQTVPQTTPINISCHWEAYSCMRGPLPVTAGGEAQPDAQLPAVGVSGDSVQHGTLAVQYGSACDCSVDRASAAAGAETQGNVIRDNTITPSADVDVSAIPGTP